MNCYIASVREENFENIKNQNFKYICFPKNYNIARKLKKGDKIVLYLGSRISVFTAILEVVDDKISILEINDKYPIRINTKPLYLLELNQYIKVKYILNQLSFIKENTTNYGAYFQRGLRKLNCLDYYNIVDIIKKKNI